MVTREALFARTAPLKIGRASRLLWMLALLIASFAAWSSWARIDEQVRAPGKIVVSSSSQLVQSVDGGVLTKLHVMQGDLVTAGQLVAELDPTRFEAHVAETRSKVLSLRANIERLEAELVGRPLRFSDDVAAVPGLVASQTDLYERRQEQQREERLATERSLALAKKELTALENLARTGDAGQTEVLRSRREVTDLGNEIVNRRNEYRRDAQQQLSAARSELDQAVQVLKQREEALLATRIHAPMSGKVKSIAVTTLGAVLKSGDEILQIVPSDDPLLVEARVSSADVAFIRPGLEANVKLDAYDFTVYGAMRGKVTYVSPDTLDVDLKQNENPYYRVLVEITRMPKDRGHGPIQVIPGMTALIEIITGERTVAQYLLKPLRRGAASALAER